MVSEAAGTEKGEKIHEASNAGERERERGMKRGQTKDRRRKWRQGGGEEREQAERRLQSTRMLAME